MFIIEEDEITNDEYFVKIPNRYIQCNVKKRYNISRMFYGIYFLIGKHKSFENDSWITIKKVFDFYRYKCSPKKRNVFYEVIQVLQFMGNNKMIELLTDLKDITYTTCIEIKILNGAFITDKNFTRIYTNQFLAIGGMDYSGKENILLVYLYVKSYIISRKIDIPNPFDYPEAFYKSTDKIAKDLGMSKSTVNKCLQTLTSGEHPLLIKKEMGFSHSEKDKSVKKLPNIYVLNKSGYETEIAWAKEKLLNITRGNFILANTE